MATRGKNYYKDGFTLDGCIQNAGLLPDRTCAIVTILKGQALHDNGSGLATNATTVLANTFLGIAAHDVDNSGDDDYVVKIIPPQQDYRFWVKVEADALIAIDNIGETVDLEQNDSIDVSDETLVAWGFKIIAIDVSTGAVAANTYGYAYGSFEKQPQ